MFRSSFFRLSDAVPPSSSSDSSSAKKILKPPKADMETLKSKSTSQRIALRQLAAIEMLYTPAWRAESITWIRASVVDSG